MSEQEFELYLKLLARCLHLTGAQREQIADELRDHLQERLEELVQAGVSREKAVLQALDEFGDAAVLAADFSTIARQRRRRFLMRLSLGSVTVLAAGLLITFAFWPQNQAIQGPAVVNAQDKPKPANAAATSAPRSPAKPRPSATATPAAAPERPVLSSDVDRDRATMRIEQALDQPIDFSLDPQPLKEAMDFISKRYNIPIIIDTKALEEAGVEPTAEIKMDLPGIPLRDMFRLLLDQTPQPLDFEIRNDVLVITTVEKIADHMVVVVYDCRDLVQVRSIEIGESARRKYENELRKEGEQKEAGTAKSAGNAPNMGQEKPKRSVLPPAIPLIRVIESATDQSKWGGEEEQNGTITEFGGLLIVRHNPLVQEQIRRVLADIRRIRKSGAFANLDKDHAVSQPTLLQNAGASASPAPGAF